MRVKKQHLFAMIIVLCCTTTFFTMLSVSEAPVRTDYNYLELAFELGLAIQPYKDYNAYDRLFRCCHTRCNPEVTNIVTNAKRCNRYLNQAVSPVKCEISKNLQLPGRMGSDNLDEIFPARDLAGCEPQFIDLTCDKLSQSSLPCHKSFRILQYNFHTQYHCLVRIAEWVNERRTAKVPKLLHQVWLYREDIRFEFYQYISMISVMRYFRPKVIFLWNEGFLPTSKWWQEFIGHLNQFPAKRKLVLPLERGEERMEGAKHDIFHRKVCLYNVMLVSVVRDKPDTIYGQTFIYPQHQSDIVRMEALLLFGGLYTDVDTITIKNLDPLLNYPVSMAYESAQTITNMAILGERFAPHLYAWHHSYTNFSADLWGENSLLGNRRLVDTCPDFVNVEKRMIGPVWENRSILYTEDVDLSNNFFVHLYWNFIDNATMLNPLETLKNPFLGARLFREIYYTCAT